MRTRTGAILPFIAIVLIALMAVLALALDGGVIKRQRRLAQNAADAGALAGAQEIFRNQSQDSIFNAAIHEAARNGYSNGSNHTKVQVDIPTAGTYVGSHYVRVQVWDTVSTILAGIVARNKVTVHTLAIGGIIPPSGDCIVSLSSSENQALRIDAGANVQALNCGIRVNSNDPDDALYVTATLNAAGGSIKVTGGASGTTTPAAQTGVTPIADPMAYLPMPAYSHTCTYTDYSINSGTVTLSPGTYCGGINIQGNTTRAQFSSGDYYILGHGFGISSGAKAVSLGNGTTFFNTCDATHSYSRINFQSAAVDTLFANTGPGAAASGVLIYQDPSCSGSGSFGGPGGGANNIQSGNNSVLSGTLYFPTQDVEIHSGSNMTISGGIVSDELWIHDNTTVNFTSGGGGGSDYFKLRRPSVVQ